MNADNFLGLEPLLIAQLKAQQSLKDLKVHVLAQADVQGVTEDQQLTPAVHVIYQGHNPTDVRSDGKAARFEQTWLVVVATRNVRNIKAGEAARAEAGLIASRVLATLMGFKPSPLAKPLRVTGAPAAVYQGGFQYLPLAFTSELAITNS